MQWRRAAVEQLEPQSSRKSFVGLFIERRPSGGLIVWALLNHWWTAHCWKWSYYAEIQYKELLHHRCCFVIYFTNPSYLKFYSRFLMPPLGVIIISREFCGILSILWTVFYFDSFFFIPLVILQSRPFSLVVLSLSSQGDISIYVIF